MHDIARAVLRKSWVDPTGIVRTQVAGLGAVLLSLMLLGGCGRGSQPVAPSPTPTPTPTPTPAPTPTPTPTPAPPPAPTPVPEVTEVLVGAGDIADCTVPGAAMTATLLDRLPGVVFTAGDNVYQSGTVEDFTNCYTPTWGRHLNRTRPSPGNHDYNTQDAGPYYAYFGTQAGPAGFGYYSYTLGAWHVVSLNSNIPAEAGSAQEQWLRADLAANQVPCTIAYFHHPLFASFGRGGDSRMRDIWQALYDNRVDVVVAGHYHFYERFARQDKNGVADPRGIREFIVGTGGATFHTPRIVASNSEVRITSTWGVVKFTLEPRSYQWEFVPVQGQSGSEVGSDACVQ